MPDATPPAAPTKVPPLVWGALLAAASLAVPAWEFGLRFLRQFFISPFQFFILPLWLVAYLGIKTGKMPTKSGPPILRDRDPAGFWQSFWASVIFGAAMWVFNLWISWAVVSRNFP